MGYEFARRGWAKEAERVLEEACLACFVFLHKSGGNLEGIDVPKRCRERMIRKQLEEASHSRRLL